MQMASEQNLNYGLFPQSFCNQNVVSFQTGMVNNTSLGMVPVTANESIEVSSRVGGLPGTMNASCSTVVPMNNTMVGTSSMIGSSDMSNSTGLVVDQSHLKYGSSISVEWSQQELAVLRDGLARYFKYYFTWILFEILFLLMYSDYYNIVPKLCPEKNKVQSNSTWNFSPLFPFCSSAEEARE